MYNSPFNLSFVNQQHSAVKLYTSAREACIWIAFCAITEAGAYSNLLRSVNIVCLWMLVDNEISVLLYAANADL